MVLKVNLGALVQEPDKRVGTIASGGHVQRSFSVDILMIELDGGAGNERIVFLLLCQAVFPASNQWHVTCLHVAYHVERRLQMGL